MNSRLLTVDFSHKVGRVKPVSGVCSGPVFDKTVRYDFTDEYRAMAVPLVRTAESESSGACVLDVHFIFPDFALDPNIELSYNFAPADNYLSKIKESGAEIFLRLGEAPDNYGIRCESRLPNDAEKWAKICEKIISHYNEGFASGYKWGIKYVEIWSGIDSDSVRADDKSRYPEFYAKVAKHIKARFPRVNVGAYSSGGFRSLNHFDATEEERGYVSYLDRFLSYVSSKDVQAPLDFLSWRCEGDSPEEISLHGNYARSYLGNYGFKKTKSIVSRFSLRFSRNDEICVSKELPALVASALIIAEKSSVDMLFLSDASPDSPSNYLYSIDDRVHKHYYAPYNVYLAFGELYLRTDLYETPEDYRRELYSLASMDEHGASILIVTRAYEGVINLVINSAPFSAYSIKGIVGGGKRGEGFVKQISDIPLDKGGITLKAGKNEVYLISLSDEQSTL